MSREEARAKGWNTFRENMLQYAREHPEFSLHDFIYQRVYGAYVLCGEARNAERRRDYKGARELYLKATESLSQAEKLVEYPAATTYVEQLKAEYFDFVIHRDPYYRENLQYILPLIKAEPGIVQSNTYKCLNLPQPEIMYTLYFADKEGLIRREKKGRSYQLFFVREKALDEPLLSLQDDEINGPISQKNDKAIGCKPVREPVHKSVSVNPEDQKFGCLTIIMFVLILVSFFIGLFGLITLGIALVILIYLTRKWIARKKAVRTRTVQAEATPPPESGKKEQKEPKIP
jgi:hypothetical protein